MKTNASISERYSIATGLTWTLGLW